MVTVAENNERHATSSPFGLMADLGAVFAAQLGMPVAYIARHLGVGVSDETARAAIIRGRRELATRRIDPGKAHRPRTAAAPPSRTGTARVPADASAQAGPRPAAPPDASPDAPSTAALLAWAERYGPQRAATHAARIRALLGELEQIRQARIREQAKEKQRLEQRRQIISAQHPTRAQYDAYLEKVRVWAREHGQRLYAGGGVPTRTILAYQAAHESQNTDEGDPHRPG